MSLTKVTQSMIAGKTVSVLDYGADPTGATDSTAAFNAAIAAASVHVGITAGVTLIGNGGTYVLGALAPITVPLIIDFQGGYVYANTTATVFDVNYSNATYNAERVVIRDVTFLGNATWALQPLHLFLIGSSNQCPNVLLENVNVWALTATGAFVHNNRGAGLTLRDCVFRGTAAPAAIYLDDDSTDSIFSNAINIDHCEISAHTGLGIHSLGADLVVSNKSIIEGCTVGGILLERRSNNTSIVDTYFEANLNYDISISGNLFGGSYAVRSCFFGGAPGTVSGGFYPGVTATARIYADKPATSGEVTLTAQDCYFYFGGVTCAAGEGVTYVGMNNTQYLQTTGWTSQDFDKELSDVCRGSMKATILNEYGVNRSNTNSWTIRYYDSLWTGATGATPPTGWSVAVAGTFSIVASGLPAPYDAALKVEHNGVNNNPGVVKTYTTVVGARYRFKASVLGSTPVASIKLGITPGGTEYIGWNGVTGYMTEEQHEFVAATTTTYIYLGLTTSTAGQYGVFDEVYLYQLSV